MQPMLFRIFTDKGLRTFSWRLSGRIVAVSGREERERAVELYFTTSMSTKQVVEHLGYPTRQCLERWLHADPRYADVVPKPPIPLGTRRRAVELCLSGMQQKQAAAELGAGDRNGGTPYLRPEPNTNCWATTRMSCAGGYGSWSWRTR